MEGNSYFLEIVGNFIITSKRSFQRSTFYCNTIGFCLFFKLLHLLIRSYQVAVLPERGVGRGGGGALP